MLDWSTLSLLFHRASRVVGCGLLALVLLVPRAASAHEVGHRLFAGPQGGISVNPDQWVLGGVIGLDGVCVIGCTRDLTLALHALSGVAGNHVTVRISPRLSYTFWIGDEDTLGVEVAAGGGVIALIPVGGFAEFCNRTDLDGCGGVWAGFEYGAGVRLWPITVHAIVGTGEVPVVTATASFRISLWEGGAP
jgi:hypothetical protein